MKPDSVKHIKEGIEEFFQDQERLYPDRHKQIHKVCCQDCPSMSAAKCQEEKDEEEEFKRMTKELIATEFAFVCAWRPSKLCKGFCDKMNINQQFLNELYIDNEKKN